MRERGSEPEKARELFDAAIGSLTQAAEHAYPDRKAQAFYERSKAHYQRGRFTASPPDYDAAIVDAESAFALQADSAYQSWIEYVRSHPPRVAA